MSVHLGALGQLAWAFCTVCCRVSTATLRSRTCGLRACCIETTNSAFRVVCLLIRVACALLDAWAIVALVLRWCRLQLHAMRHSPLGRMSLAACPLQNVPCSRGLAPGDAIRWSTNTHTHTHGIQKHKRKCEGSSPRSPPSRTASGCASRASTSRGRRGRDGRGRSPSGALALWRLRREECRPQQLLTFTASIF